MPMLPIHAVMNGLSERRPIFHSEADFQFALAWEIRQKLGFEVRLEFKHKATYLDLWLPTEGVAIELKYATRKLEHEEEGERFALKDQSANDIKRYDYVKDINRIENVLRERGDAENGLAVFLTNDWLYWDKPRKDWERRLDAAFRIHQGRRIERGLAMKWQEEGTGTTKSREEPITTRDSYTLKWNDYKSLKSNEKSSRFRYLAVKVGK